MTPLRAHGGLIQGKSSRRGRRLLPDKKRSGSNPTDVGPPKDLVKLDLEPQRKP